MKHNAKLLAVAAVTLALAAPAQAQYQINWYSINSGGGEVTSASYRLNGSIGQSVAGYIENGNYKHWIGFWAGSIGSVEVIEDLADVKLLNDGAAVSVAGKIATSGNGDFDDFFYIQEPDRSNGIRVSVPVASVVGLARGSTVNVVGTLGTTADGERHITGPAILIVGSATVPAPLVMANTSLGGADFGVPPAGQFGVAGGKGVNNIGLLVQTTGLVTGSAGGFLTIDDGSGVSARIDPDTLAAPPGVDDYITIIGISSLNLSGSDRLPLVLPRDDADIEVQ